MFVLRVRCMYERAPPPSSSPILNLFVKYIYRLALLSLFSKFTGVELFDAILANKHLNEEKARPIFIQVGV